MLPITPIYLIPLTPSPLFVCHLLLFRRGLEYQHIDTILHQIARPTVDNLRVRCVCEQCVWTILNNVCDCQVVIRDPEIMENFKISLRAITFYDWQNFYGERLGKIYIVHANWFFWSGFFLILKPLLGLVSRKSDKILLLSDAKGKGNDACDLQGHFDRFPFFCNPHIL